MHKSSSEQTFHSRNARPFHETRVTGSSLIKAESRLGAMLSKSKIIRRDHHPQHKQNDSAINRNSSEGNAITPNALSPEKNDKREGFSNF